MPARGGGCTKSGRLYELEIFNIVQCCLLNDKPFNTQTADLLGGSSAKNDIECNLNDENDVPIEIKRGNTPDWMQCSLKHDASIDRWRCATNNKIPYRAKAIFEEIIDANATQLFNGKIPPFVKTNIRYTDWLKVKDTFSDVYLACPNDTIKRLYAAKGCKYIQISQKGLYHLGDDVCNFEVPEFVCNQHLRIRAKIHNKKNRLGFCVFSMMIACKPTHIRRLVDSPYSLDDRTRLPPNLHITA